MRLRRSVRERIRWCKSDTLPGQTLKRKKWIVVSIVLICASFDVLLLFITEKAISPLLEDAPYLPKEYAQAYTHVATLRDESHRRLSNDINAIAFSPDGKIFATGGNDRDHRLYDVTNAEIQLWDADTGHLLHTFNSPGSRIKLLTFSPDGKTLASVGEDLWNKIFIWDLENHRLLSIITTHERAITALQFAPDSITLASSHSNGTVNLWDITGRTKR